MQVIIAKRKIIEKQVKTWINQMLEQNYSGNSSEEDLRLHTFNKESKTLKIPIMREIIENFP